MQPSIIKRARVLVEMDGDSGLSATGGRATTRCVKKAAVIEHGGVVRGIEITCSCGETTVVEFLGEESKEGKKS